MKLSLIIATYNRAAWLTRALESVVQQSAECSVWECIVVNNNSTDDTYQQFELFTAAHPGYNLRMVVEQKQGLSNARNRGIAEATGDYIAIVDDDETLEDTFIESYIDFFDAFPLAMVAGGAVVPRYESGRPRWMSHYPERMIANPIDLDIAVCEFPSTRVPAGGNMAFRREVFEQVGGFNPLLGRSGESLCGGEENDLFARLKAQGYKFYFIPNAAIYHHIPDSKLTDEYFYKLSFNVGRSKYLRTELQGSEAVQRLLKAERIKQIITWGLAALYTLALQPSKARYLLRMRRGIMLGIESARK